MPTVTDLGAVTGAVAVGAANPGMDRFANKLAELGTATLTALA